MTKYHTTTEGNVPFTAEEEKAWEEKEILIAQEAPKISLKTQICELESLITVRRQREAILSIDNGWLADIEIQIGQLRQQLAGM
jgi:hypothetical protein